MTNAKENSKSLTEKLSKMFATNDELTRDNQSVKGELDKIKKMRDSLESDLSHEKDKFQKSEERRLFL